MKKHIFLIALIAIQLSLSDCAYIYSKSNNVAAKVEKLVEDEKYGLALDTLEFITPDHFNYVYLMEEKKRVKKLASAFEDNTLKLAANHEKQKHWAKAMKVYNNGLDKYPQSKKIAKARKIFIAKRDKYLNQLKNKLLVSNAKTLSKKTATTKEIAQVNPDDFRAKKMLRSHIREVNLTSEKLITCAKDGIKNKDIQLAEECLTLAVNLSTSKKTNEEIESLEKKLQAIRNSRTKKHKKSIIKINKKLSQVKTTSELIAYRKEVLYLYRLNKNNKKIKRLKKELDAKIKTVLRTEIKKGQDYYSQGRIKKALSHWKELQQLDDSNQKLNDYIHRAERVLKKLQSLSNNPTPVQLPATTN